MRKYKTQIKILAAIGLILIAAVFLTAAFTPQERFKRFAAPATGSRESTAPAQVDLYPVNINTAGKAQLQTIPAVGEKTAENIIRYREEHGAFESIEDIQNVKGIGAKTYESMKEYITIHGS